MHIFLAGIMQGSHLGAVLHNQNYRTHLKELLREHLPHAQVYDPLADHENSLDYDADQGRQVFLHHNRMCSEVDVVLAFIPEASMGTAIEIWEAHRHGRCVISVSPLSHNWAVRFLSDHLYPDLETLEAELASGRFSQRVEAIIASRRSLDRH